MRNEFWPPLALRVTKLMALASGAIVLASAGMIGVDVLARSVLGREVIDSFELTSFGLAVSFALGLPYSVATGAHIRINALERFKLRALDNLADLAAFLSMAIFAVFLAYFAVEAVIDSLHYNAKSNSTLGLPIAIPQALWAFGLVLFALISLFVLVRAVQWMAVHRTANLMGAALAEHDDEIADLEGIGR
ncbi:MAG: TRAP transporter small permease subunit [Reyranellaceae bacterium]